MKNIGVWLLSLVVVCMMSCAKPIAQFEIERKDNIAPSKVRFNNESQNAESYEWDFGDGNTSTEPAPEHRFQSSGNYVVSLKASKGKKSTITTQRIQIIAPEVCMVELVTEFGNMTIELYDDTPAHRDNFIKLVTEGFYDGLLFHRVMDGFMVQGGDPTSKNAKPNQTIGNSGPGYDLDAEISTAHVHTKGALAAARQPDEVNPEKKSSGSQFYIVHGQPVTEDYLDRIESLKDFKYSEADRKAYLENGGAPQLEMEYTVFGRVVDGFEVIDKIASVKTQPNNRPTEDVIMDFKIIE